MRREANDETTSRYLKDIRATRPVSREEERELFRRAHAGDGAARDRLIRVNMRFVLSVALRYHGCPIPLPDRISEGAMGLMRAVDEFDLSRDLKFVSYAVWWIRAYITKAVNETGSTIRLPSSQHLRVRKALKDARRGVEIPSDIRELIQLGDSGASFDAPVKGAGDDVRYQDVVADENAVNPEAEAEARDSERLVAEFLSELSGREAEVIRAYFGLDRPTARTLDAVGQTLGITRERVRQIREQAIRRMRGSSRVKRGRYDLDARVKNGGTV